MVQAGMTYGLRARAAFRPRRSQASLSTEDQHQPAAAATVGAGLRPGVMTKAELLRFSGRQTNYLNARNLILQKWDVDVTRFLTVDACVEAAEDGMKAIVAEAHAFLQEQGCINIGVPLGEPSKDEEPEEEGLDDDELRVAVYELLKAVDLDVTTEKMIRAQLEKKVGVDLHDRKHFIREQVKDYLGGKLPPKSKKAKKKAKVKPGKVVVVGAGPAGLAAALHLKRCGVETVVLEARDRVGGRVHSHTGSGFSAPIDLGASIITGIDTNVASGLRPDPSAIVARQLGIELHRLRRDLLPLYDGVTGQRVPKDTDDLMDRVRDALLDDARERVDTLGEAATEAESLGAALDRAFAQRFSGPAAAPAAAAATAGTADGAADGTAAEEPSDGAATGAQEEAGSADLAEIAVVTNTKEEGALPSSLASGEGAPSAERQAAIAGAAEADANDDSKAAANGEKEHEADGKGAASEGPVPAAADGTDQASDGTAVKASTDAHELVPAEAGAEAGKDAVSAAPEGKDTNSEVEPGSPAEAAAAAAAENGATDVPSNPTALSGAEGGSGAVLPGGDLEQAPLPASLSEAELRLLDWHWSNLEYGCSASLDQVSLVHWNQDEEYGGFGGDHCMVRGGYSAILTALAGRLDVRLSSPVISVSDTSDGVTITVASGEEFKGAAVIITVPLGCLKAGDVTFSPSLPPWKADAVDKLGFGDLNKVVLEFPHTFWEDSADFFGAAVPGGPEGRGRCFMFWNLHRMAEKPILITLMAGKAAYESEKLSDEEMSAAAMEVLRRLFGEDIPQPVSLMTTKWGSDTYSRGSYSYVTVGSSAKTYDALAAPVRRRVLWAGEHTCKEHPDTVGGAMLSGMREAVRAVHLLAGDDDTAAHAASTQVDSITAAKGRPSKEVDEGDGFVVEDSEEERPKKQTKVKAKKRRAEEDDEDEVSASPVEGRKRRAREAATEMELPMSREERAAEMARREVHREQTKTIFRALMVAELGDMKPIRTLLSGAADAESRAAILRALLEAGPDALAALAADAASLRAIDLWLLQTMPETRAFHLLGLALKVLQKLPERLDVLRSSGVAATVGERVTAHPNRAVREAAERLRRRWADEPEQAPAAAPDQAQAPQNGHGRHIGATADAGGARPPTPGSEEEAAEVMDPDLVAKLAAAEEAEREAAELAAKRAELEEEVARARAAAAQLPTILGFKEATRSKRSGRNRDEKLARRRARAEAALAEAEEEEEEGAPGKEKAKAAEPSAYSKENASGSKPSSSRSHNVAPKVKKEVEEFVADVLKPMYAAKSISREDYKWIMHKAINKILEMAAAKGGDTFVTSRRRPKIRDLVEKYIRLRRDGSRS